MDIGEFMPDAEAQAKILGSIADYNEKRAAVHAEVGRNIRLYLAVYVAVAVLLFLAVGYVFDLSSVLNAPFLILFAAAVILGFFVREAAKGPARRFQQAFRDEAFPKMFGFVEDVRYEHRVRPDSFARLPREATGQYSLASFDDVVSGRYAGFPFELYETELSRKSGKSRTTIFRGLVMAFQPQKAFPGRLVATNALPQFKTFMRDLFGTGGLQKVESGNAELDSIYEFRSDNPEAARPLIAGNLARALDWMRKTWPEEAARVVLRDDDGFILLPVRKNHFELPDISVELSYEAHVKPIIAEMVSLLATASLVRKAVA